MKSSSACFTILSLLKVTLLSLALLSQVIRDRNNLLRYRLKSASDWLMTATASSTTVPGPVSSQAAEITSFSLLAHYYSSSYSLSQGGVNQVVNNFLFITK